MACDPGESVGAFLCQAGQMLRAAAIENPRLEARLLLGHAMGASTEALLRDPRAVVPPAAAARFRAALAQRLRAVPVAHILGRQGFWTLDLAVSPATLIPRPDTETLVEAALELFPDAAAPLRVLDLGTGTGALLLAVLAERPRAVGVGVDLVPARRRWPRPMRAPTGWRGGRPSWPGTGRGRCRAASTWCCPTRPTSRPRRSPG
jgi:release factor glutamine methyltransferase